MSLAGWMALPGAVLLAALALGGCNGGGGAGAGGATSTTSTGSTSTTIGSSSSGAGGGPVYEPSGFSCSGKTRSLSADVIPITESNCSKSAACHLAMQSASGVEDQFVNIISEECNDLRLMIKPGDPEASYVIHKLTDHNLCSPPTTMPLDGGALSPGDIQTIYDWICQGAPSN
jgi:hypothetical protein